LWKVVGPKRGFLIQGDDRVGAIADNVGKLADAKINVTAIDAISTDGRYDALCWVAARDMKKAAAVPRQNPIARSTVDLRSNAQQYQSC
jgi:predicted amino acid-binding ACT domain protein